MSSLVFPIIAGRTLDITRSPEWKTTVQQALSGKRTTIARQFFPRIRFQLKYDLLRDDIATSDLKALVGLFNQLKGMYDTFLFTDPDYNAISGSNPSPFGISTGLTTSLYQLMAYYGNVGGTGYYEMMQALNGTPVLYDNGSVITSSHYTIGATGIVQFSTSPAAGHTLTWSGSFYYRCRFDSDDLDLSKFMNKWWESKQLPFTQVLL